MANTENEWIRSKVNNTGLRCLLISWKSFQVWPRRKEVARRENEWNKRKNGVFIKMEKKAVKSERGNKEREKGEKKSKRKKQAGREIKKSKK